MEKVIERSWNVVEFGFENCVGGTLRMVIKIMSVLCNYAVIDYQQFNMSLAKLLTRRHHDASTTLLRLSRN